MTVVTALVVLAALAVGMALGWWLRAAKGDVELARAGERLAATAAGEEAVRRSLALLNEDAARRHSGAIGESIARVVDPLRDAVDALENHVRVAERDRVSAYAGLTEQVAGMHRASRHLASQTDQLVTALRAPQIRGRWGEMQLERVVELAGMTRHCDFDTQVVGDGIRPDLVVRLAGGRSIVVDAKVPLVAFLDAAAETDPETVDRHLERHARHLRTHVDALADKKYWRAFDPSPEFVVLFVPGDPFLDAALTRDRGLLEHAFTRNVVLATPTTLIALLRTVAFTWRQESLAEDAAAVVALGRELYERLGTVGDHVDKVGSHLGKAVDAFNTAVGSLDNRVFVTARRLHEMSLFDGDPPTARTVDARPRSVVRAATHTTASSCSGHADEASA
ncbi:DNA recombination protein RmuC [Rhodococcoides corynebacterioides]|uniref:DNA recombination protein RmuC n=1 Tax=Rhodococcoides corynebacterioides TaxID=53972 RepID=A0ABS7NZN5_9NOCA|nr:DNA recombination protein RmuC [Rhodococcus corynebacterioides]MBY6365592.1 DNA recombination protein RmuC [Rhodococcus corynebacterioides]MBY6406323.1 DNA recombination protein RmuC [Rhodococcus corynebacterioides]